MEEYFAGGRDKIIVDPDPNKIFTKQKARESSISPADSWTLIQIKDVRKVNYPTTDWGEALEKLPLPFLKLFCF